MAVSSVNTDRGLMAALRRWPRAASIQRMLLGRNLARWEFAARDSSVLGKHLFLDVLNLYSLLWRIQGKSLGFPGGMK